VPKSGGIQLQTPVVGGQTESGHLQGNLRSVGLGDRLETAQAMSMNTKPCKSATSDLRREFIRDVRLSLGKEANSLQNREKMRKWS
jgi:hypothetical protein